MKLLLVLLAIFTTCVAATAQSQTSKATKYIDDLLATPNIGHVYYEDGASDGSILLIGIDYENDVTRPLPAVKALVDLKSLAIPVLIGCMDDTRLTSATYQTRNVQVDTPTPLGFVCLDIVSGIVQSSSKLFVPDCADDGLGACYKAGFYFRPDVLMVSGSPEEQMRRVKRNWKRAFDEGWLKFQYPDNWTLYPVQPQAQ